MSLPSKPDVVRANREHASTKNIHRKSFIAQLLLLVRTHLTMLDSIFARMVGFCVLIQAVGSSDGSDGG